MAITMFFLCFSPNGENKNREVLLNLFCSKITQFMGDTESQVHILSLPECRGIGAGLFHVYSE